jgi:hypothetical protein
MERTDQVTDELRLTIAIPTAGKVSMDFAFSLCALMSYHATKGFPIAQRNVVLSMDVVRSTIIPGNRETLASRALKKGQTHLMFIDDDMTFQPSILDLLLSRKRPVVITNYLIKTMEPKFVAIGLDGKRVPTEEESTGLEQVVSGGFGVSLFETEVFKKTAKPWFMPDFIAHEDAYTPEDAPFFRRVTEAGFPIMLDQDASKMVRHQGLYEWSWEAWQGAA